MNDKKKCPRVSDTLPSRGRVNEVCKEWLVHEDGALAYKLQKEEVEQHYSGNKSRNAQVREDTPRAKEEQLREDRDAFIKYQEMLQQQAEQDEYIALKIAESLEKEEERQRRRRELHDEAIARRIQENERPSSSEKTPRNIMPNMNEIGHNIAPNINEIGRHIIPNMNEIGRNNVPNANDIGRNHVSNVNEIGRNMIPNVNEIGHIIVPNVNEIGLPVVESRDLASQTRGDISSQLRTLDLNSQEEEELFTSMDLRVVLDDSNFQEEAHRRLQEQKDEELARLLQEQDSGSLSLEDRDRLLAMEAQDKELARLLQEKEKARARRAREKAKQKALLKKQQLLEQQQLANESCEQHNQDIDRESGERETNIDEPSHSTSHNRSLQEESFERRSLEDNKSEVYSPSNIAVAIDPTYNSMPSYSCGTGDCVAPPYMPIQGQRRVSSLEKKCKRKDACKHQ